MDVTSPPDENSKCGATQEAADETELECLGTSGGQIMAISAGEDTHVTPEIEGSQIPPSNVDGAIQSLQPQKYLSSTAIEQVLSFCNRRRQWIRPLGLEIQAASTPRPRAPTICPKTPIKPISTVSFPFPATSTPCPYRKPWSWGQRFEQEVHRYDCSWT